MKTELYSYRFAEEILQHSKFEDAWLEIVTVLEEAPLFVFPGKSTTNPKLDVVQQLMNTYFDRRLAIDLGWLYHPMATRIEDSKLRADFRKEFSGLAIHVEVQFGNMARWYSDVFKFQTAYSQRLIHLALSVVPMKCLGVRMDSNVVSFERAFRELPSAELSITLPILLAGIEPDESTTVHDVSKCKFSKATMITKNSDNQWRIINGIISGMPVEEIGPESPIGEKPSQDSANHQPE